MIGPNPTRVCVDWVHFPMLCSGSDAKFRQHLPAVLLIHVSAINREDVYPENNRGGTDEIYASDPEQSIWENKPNLHILGLSMDSVGQFERIKVIICKCMHIYNYDAFKRET